MFKWILENSLRNRLLVIIGALVLMAYGAFTLSRTPVDVFPDLNKPTVTLMTEAGGMAAEEVEQLISFPLETAMNGLPNVESVRSVSSAGLSFIYVTFDWSTDIFRARQMVSERLSSLEEGIAPGVTPTMGPISSVMGEIMQIAIPIGAKPGKETSGKPPLSAMDTREYADWVLRPRLMAIPGVAQVIPIGGEVRQFQVQPNTSRMGELGVTADNLDAALKNFSANTSGGFLELNGREYLIRNLGRTSRLDDLRNLPLTVRGGQPILLHQVADVRFAAAIKRGDAGFEGMPAVILGVQKQPTADTIALTQAIESALVDMKGALPAGMSEPQVTFRQANFIEASIHTLQGKLIGAAAFVAVILFFFLGTLRPLVIALTAIPASIFVTGLVFHYFGMSINTMTLGGLAIAIGGLVDDAVVDVENIMRRLKEDRARDPSKRLNPLEIVAQASMEVRSAILYATVIIVLVFMPMFALPGMEGRLFVPLGIAFIVSTLASLLVSVTVTPVLSYYLLPKMKSLDHGDTRVLAWLKSRYQAGLWQVLRRPRAAMSIAGVAVVLAIAAVPFFPTTFLPPFNEGTLLVGLRLNPGVTLAESSTLARQAELLVAQVPEVQHVGRRSGRAELDEHAEGVHVSELDVGLLPASELTRSMDEITADIRSRLANLPGSVGIGQPISHRIDHMLSGVRSQIAIKIFGEDLDTLRGQAEQLRTKLAGIAGVADLEVEKQVLAPQIKVRVDYAAAARYGIAAPQILSTLQGLVEGERVTEVVEGNRRFALVIRLPENARSVDGLQRLLIDTPMGRIPLSQVAVIEESDGPNQVSRDDGRRRIVLSANAQGRPLSDVVADIRAVVAEMRLPEGYFITMGGQFQAQEEASRLVGMLSIVSLVLMFVVLYTRYQSVVLSGLIMVNIPLALVGAVVGLWLSGQPLSIAALVGFITLAGISVRNGILKVSHYLNLMRLEGESFDQRMIVRGSLERLSPVLMTALVTAFALAPLLFEAERPGTEILHPVAVVIFSGLVSSTLLDTFLTPTMFWLFGRKPAERLVDERSEEAF
ncbi:MULTISPECIES: efflux RND transporter permease subunit [Enterobacteriaceae]|uniref:efflux RND transporter permease subunit n=1 Tax=Enterobacteriaceae TaxID=543 RepID=UPI00165917E3|nr:MULTISPECIES: efflux RND transporter permease subunit [Enterobacteriaceae]MCD9354730.1 efflux RND transporter permease subunit [Klebsiella pneumoniae]MCD9415404.1 efflux RND transporter permease subunit [Klebsiella pneumoniae]MCD9608990.1 efflux RND transporter permease subunit [Raoultella planticola]MDE9664876.1 efflux RND transporter permease subunit [Citrobacter portucalensis]MDE9674516.1 efflux RND transporter permease subunit [Citrobacter portucalensis]